METKNCLLRSDLLGDSNFKCLPFNGKCFFFHFPGQSVEGTRSRTTEHLPRDRIDAPMTGARKFMSLRMPSVMASQMRTDWREHGDFRRRMLGDPDIVSHRFS